jgi:hypothetical protein
MEPKRTLCDLCPLLTVVGGDQRRAHRIPLFASTRPRMVSRDIPPMRERRYLGNTLVPPPTSTVPGRKRAACTSCCPAEERKNAPTCPTASRLLSVPHHGGADTHRFSTESLSYSSHGLHPRVAPLQRRVVQNDRTRMKWRRSIEPCLGHAWGLRSLCC